jgi:ferredoxin
LWAHTSIVVKAWKQKAGFSGIKEKDMKTLYFTATGNSLYVAKRIGGELLSIPKLIAEGRFELEDEAIGIVYPCYGWGIPRIVEEFLAKAKLKADYKFAVMTYGNTAASGLSVMKTAARKIGIVFDYTNEVLMVDNYLPIFDIKDQLAKEASKGIEQKLALVTAEIAARKRGLLRKNPVSDALFGLASSGLACLLLSDDADKKFTVNADCNGCGICAKVCPRKNIKMEGKPQFLHGCEGCLACINNCPRTALHLKSEKSGARFRNSHVALSEITAANDRH